MTSQKHPYLRSRWLRRILLDGLGRWWRWTHTLAYFAFVLWIVWLASPYFVFRIMGAPDITSVPSYTGTVRMDDSLQRGITGWSAPRYYVQTEQGEKKFFCGYLPKQRSCFFFSEDPRKGSIYKVYFHEYFGTTYIEYPIDDTRNRIKSKPGEMTWYFEGNSNRHQKYVNYLYSMLFIYALALGIYILHDD